MSEEKSAIETIYSIESDIKELKSMIKLLDNNIKLLNNKFKKLTDLEKVKETSVDPVNQSDSKNVSSKSIVSKNSTVKVFGKVKNQKLEPIKGVKVTIYSNSGEVIKSRISDVNGYWEARVFSGQYSIELDPRDVLKNSQPFNRTIDVPDNVEEFEVRMK